MPSSPAVSIVIPAYKAHAFLHRAVASIEAQTFRDWEVIIAVDDGEDYASVLASKGLDTARLRFTSTGGVRRGAGAARNAGLDTARAPFVATLDADDRLAPATLEQLLPAAREHGVAFAARRIVEDVTGRDLPSYDRELPAGLVSLEDILTSQIHSYAGVVFDRLRVPARWPSGLWEDVAFFARCFDHVEGMFHASEPLYEYFKRDGSICNRAETGDEYLGAAEELLARLAGGETLGIERGRPRAVFGSFLEGRRLVEIAFMNDVKAGRCVDFRDFVSRRPELFYALPKVIS